MCFVKILVVRFYCGKFNPPGKRRFRCRFQLVELGQHVLVDLDPALLLHALLHARDVVFKHLVLPLAEHRLSQRVALSRKPALVSVNFVLNANNHPFVFNLDRGFAEFARLQAVDQIVESGADACLAE